MRLAPLRFLLPYAFRYKTRLALALLAMLCATSATLLNAMRFARQWYIRVATSHVPPRYLVSVGRRSTI